MMMTRSEAITLLVWSDGHYVLVIVPRTRKILIVNYVRSKQLTGDEKYPLQPFY